MSDFPALPFSNEGIQLRSVEGRDEICDVVRKKWLVLTPEEWVRQHFLLYLMNELGYPPSAIAVEKKVEINGMPKRFDALVYLKGNPIILIECKAPQVKITEDVFHQACRYNTVIKAPITVLTNGHKTVTAQVDLNTQSVQFLPHLPLHSAW